MSTILGAVFSGKKKKESKHSFKILLPLLAPPPPQLVLNNLFSTSNPPHWEAPLNKTFHGRPVALHSHNNYDLFSLGIVVAFFSFSCLQPYWAIFKFSAFFSL